MMVVVALLVVGLQHGQGRAETFLRWLARKFHFDGDTAAAALRQIGARLEDLVADRQLLKRVVLWASLNWLLDAASLWVFLLRVRRHARHRRPARRVRPGQRRWR